MGKFAAAIHVAEDSQNTKPLHIGGSMAAATFTFDEATHTYTQNGVVIPSVTQILKLAGLVDYSNVDPAVLARKAAIGTEVHRATQLLDEGARLTDLELDPAVLPYVECWSEFVRKEEYEPLLIEYGAVVNVHGFSFGMTIDRKSLFKRKKCVLDIKCACVPYIHWGCQLAGYDCGMKYLGHDDIEERVIVHLKPQNKQKKYVVLRGHNSRLRGFKPYDDPRFDAQWLAALTLASLKIEDGEDLPDGISEEGEA